MHIEGAHKFSFSYRSERFAVKVGCLAEIGTEVCERNNHYGCLSAVVKIIISGYFCACLVFVVPIKQFEFNLVHCLSCFGQNQTTLAS
jgi:hypothetical protein